MTVLFVSDLHLDAVRPAITALFLDFLAGEARGAEALYILGDLFEAWVGDDDPGEPGASVCATRPGRRISWPSRWPHARPSRRRRARPANSTRPAYRKPSPT